MDGLALERAVMAAKAQASSSKNPTPVQIEDLQPNEALRRRRNAGLPPVVAATKTKKAKWGRGERKDVMFHWSGRPNPERSHATTWETQNDHSHRSAQSSSLQRTNSVTGSQMPNPKSGQLEPCAFPQHHKTPNQSTSIRGRALPLPPLPPTTHVAHQEPRHVQVTNDHSEPIKQFTKPLPALQLKPPLSGITGVRIPKPRPTLLRPASPMDATGRHMWENNKGLEGNARRDVLSPGVSEVDEVQEVSMAEEPFKHKPNPKRLFSRPVTTLCPVPGRDTPSPKRRKLDSSSESPQRNIATDGTASRASYENLSSPQPSFQKHSPLTFSPTTTYVASPPVNIKREPESTTPPIEERRIVTSYVTRFSLPENCEKTHLQWQINRRRFGKEKEFELRKKGLELVGPCITRDDGICFEWKSQVPVWCDTLEPASCIEMDRAGPDHGRLPYVADITELPILGYPSPQYIPSRSPSQPMRGATPRTSVSPMDEFCIATVSPLAVPSSDSPRKLRSQVPRGELDLAAAIELSQQDNALSKKPRSRSALISPSTRKASLGIGCSPQPVESSRPSSVGVSPRDPMKKRPERGYKPGHQRWLGTPQDQVRMAKGPAKMPIHGQAALAEEWGDSDGERIDDALPVADASSSSEQQTMLEAVRAGWTVIEEVGSSDRGEENEDERDELVEDDENELRDEMEAAKAVSLEEKASGTTRPALMAGTKVEPPRSPANSSSVEEGAMDNDALVRDFISRYMQTFETDRDCLVRIYAPNAVLRYRVLESQSQEGSAFLPLIIVVGHQEIASSLLSLNHIHFSQTEDENGNKRVDLEYHKEKIRDDISLYVRSLMTVEDDVGLDITSEEQNSGMKREQTRIVDHDFWLCRNESPTAKDHQPFVIRNHMMIMHEAPLVPSNCSLDARVCGR